MPLVTLLKLVVLYLNLVKNVTSHRRKHIITKGTTRLTGSTSNGFVGNIT